MPVHEGHRSRKKEQFRAHGLDAFADHEVLAPLKAGEFSQRIFALDNRRVYKHQ